MLLKELIRFLTQHRTLHCYILLSVWILLLITGMYKYIGNNSLGNPLRSSNAFRQLYGIANPSSGKSKNKDHHTQYCTPIESVVRKDDGGLLEGWKLQGVLLIIRHGDRGPMLHVRGISSIDCGTDGDTILNRYKSFLLNTTGPSGANHMFWNKIGPFHGFPLLPPTSKSCHLMQLTYKGISQLLHVGDIMHQVYAHPLGLMNRPLSKSSVLPTPYDHFNSDEVVVYVTRYRRTFQSAMALLFAFLPIDKWLTLNVRESHSMSFCFADCACPQADEYRKWSTKLVKSELSQHPSIGSVIQSLGQSLLQHSSSSMTGNAYDVRDAVLALLCHDAHPCQTAKIANPKESITISPPTTLDLNDVINIDQDDTVVANAFESIRVADPKEAPEKQNRVCIENGQITTVMSFTNWLSRKESRQKHYRRNGLLRAYGMIRNIVSYMLKMISGDRTKFVLYSGHDWTMQFVTSALGIDTQSTFIPYASRLAFEVYKSETHTEYYFRVVYNGRDVTQQIDFCEGGKSLRISRDSRGNKADLCPIENIIRFIHDDYFVPLNATNFKDACSTQKD